MHETLSEVVGERLDDYGREGGRKEKKCSFPHFSYRGPRKEKKKGKGLKFPPKKKEGTKKKKCQTFAP